MKRIIRSLTPTLLLLFLLTSCQHAGIGSYFIIKSSPTPSHTTTLMPTETPTPTETPPPTATATATITPTRTLALVSVEAGNIEVPILLYHHVNSEISNSRYNIDPAVFEEQMKWLYDNHYKTITISNVASLILNGGQMPSRPVVITFDDGNLDVFKIAYPILEKYGFVATFYVVNQYVNGKNMISTDQVKELIDQGWEIGSHSEHHQNLTAENADLETEIRLSKLHLADKLGVPINSFAYPFGSVNEEVITKTIRSGYTSAVGLGESITHGRYDVFYLIRMEIQRDYSMDKFISLLPWSGPIQ